MTAQADPRVRFRRAIEARSVFLAELAAREMGVVSLEEALALVLLYGAAEDPKYARAAVDYPTIRQSKRSRTSAGRHSRTRITCAL